MHHFTKERRDELIAAARAICEKAKAEHRDLTGAEQKAIDEGLGEVKGINAALAAEAKSRKILGALDDMAASASFDGQPAGGLFGGKAAHVALTGEHAGVLAANMIKASPSDAIGRKSLVTGGTQTTSTVLLPDIVVTGRPAVSVLDVLPARIVPPSYTFLRQSSRSLAAAPVAVGGTKPTSAVSAASIENRLRVIAHISEPIDQYLLSDNVNLQRFVADELVYGLRVSVESQVISGTGVGENMTGVLNTSGILAPAFSVDILTTVRKAITLLDGQGYTPGVIVLHASDWESVELLTATSGSTDVRGVPVDPVTRRLWGTPVVVNNTLGAGVGLVIGAGAVSVDTDGRVDIKWSDAVGSDFSANAVRCRVESRFGVSVHQPGAVVKLDTAA